MPPLPCRSHRSWRTRASLDPSSCTISSKSARPSRSDSRQACSSSGRSYDRTQTDAKLLIVEAPTRLAFQVLGQVVEARLPIDDARVASRVPPAQHLGAVELWHLLLRLAHL